MTPIDWAILPLKKYATFSGRAPRAEFWWFTLMMIIIYTVVMIATGALAGGMMRANPAFAIMTGSVGVGTILTLVIWVAMLIPSIAVQVRRLHDTNRSGWWLGAFWVLYVVYMVAVFSAGMGAGRAPDSSPSMGSLAGIGILAIVMLIASVTLLVFFCMRGTAGPNRYGEDPYGANVEEVFA